MIAPDFRVSDQLAFTAPVKNFISFNYGTGLGIDCLGDSMYADLEMDMVSIEKLHNDCRNLTTHKCDPNQLNKFKDMLLQ